MFSLYTFFCILSFFSWSEWTFWYVKQHFHPVVVGPWESPRLTNNPISRDLLRRGWRENELSWPVIQRQINRCSHDALVQLAYAEKKAIKCRLLYCGDNSHGFLCKGFGGHFLPWESKLSNVVQIYRVTMIKRNLESLIVHKLPSL